MKIKARLKKQFSKASLEKRIAFGLAILALLSGTATYLKLNDASLLEPGNRIVFPLLLVD
ncbi:MAG: hypothetical protein HOI80_04430, partial [Alphaproteobacteria bacterium]|nr:hypothetical protein [Alphaproteobacteria bacterium]